ncbi:MAG: BrnT family toxin [Deltaproteobacteria bacterium]|nr:BrnT family toxin [Deltaproteobacteria bacterium]
MQFWGLEPEWDDNNIEHIARHVVEPEEVEEIVYEDCYPSWIVHIRRRWIRETRWMVFGQTCGGWYLLAVIAPYPRRGVWRAVSARDMERQTRRRYQQWRRN